MDPQKQRFQTRSTRAACGPPRVFVLPSSTSDLNWMLKWDFIGAYKHVRLAKSIFLLNAGRANLLLQNVARNWIWVWYLCFKVSNKVLAVQSEIRC